MTLARLWRIARQRLRAFSRPDEMDAELGRELAFHFEQLVRENTAEGMPLNEARQAARRALGNPALLAEQCRDHRRTAWLQDLRQDIRFGLRMLRKTPVVTAIAAISLALGIGANTAVLGLVGTVLLGDLPFPDAGRLVVIRTVSAQNPRQTYNAPAAGYLTWSEQGRGIEALGASINLQGDFGVEPDGTPAARVEGEGFSASLFRVLGIPPERGRVFSEAEDTPERPAQVLVISHRLWQRRFGGDAGIVGRRVRLNGQVMTVIGVMPPAFHYPNDRQDYWLPLRLTQTTLQGQDRLFLVTARLHPGVSLAQAQAELDSIQGHEPGWGIRLESLRDAWYGWLKEPLLTIEAAAFFILLIACANVTGLLLARGAARRPELAMRVALGAGRGRVIRQLLTESVVLSLAGGVLGALVAWAALRSLPFITPPPAMPRLAAVGWNARVLGALALLSLGAGIAFGLAPALAAFRLDLNRSLKESVPVAGAPSRRRLREMLVTAQIALAFVLLTGAGLLNTSFLRMVGRDLHFDPKGLLTFEVRLPQQQYLRTLGLDRGFPVVEVSPSPSQTLARMYERLCVLPEVESAAGSSYTPVNSLYLPSVPLAVEGQAGVLAATYFLVTPNFFGTMRTPLLGGREFSSADTAASPWGVIVNETAARRFWPGGNAIGKRLRLDAGPDEQPREVIGIVPDIPPRRIQTAVEPVLYASYMQQPARYRGPGANMFGQMTFLLRTSGDRARLAAAVRQAIAEIDPDRPVGNLTLMAVRLNGRIAEQRDYGLVLGIFALTAMLLAAIGVYGVVAYAVAQRTREIGIRMALGASAGSIIQCVGRSALAQIAAGLGIGLAGSLLLTRMIAGQLWNIAPTDPATFSAAGLLLISMALLACFVPARRAVRVDPVEALRGE